MCLNKSCRSGGGKSVAFFLSLSLAFLNTFSGEAPPSFAEAPLSRFPFVEEASSQTFPKNLTELTLPSGLGVIQEVHQAPSQQTILYVQDAHTLYEAQKSIQGIIDYFQKHYGLKLILLEGGSGRLDPFLFRTYPNPRHLKEVFEHYLEKGELSGAVAAAALNEEEANYFGIEDQRLYEAGSLAFLEALKAQPEIQKKINLLQRELDEAKEKIYPRELLELDRAFQAFQDQEIDSSSFLNVLKRFPPLEALMKEGKGGPIFLKELEGCLEEIYSSFLLSEEGRRLKEEESRFRPLNHLAHFELTRSEWERLQKEKGRYLPWVKEFSLQSHFRFYEIAQRREEAMLGNLMRWRGKRAFSVERRADREGQAPSVGRGAYRERQIEERRSQGDRDFLNAKRYPLDAALLVAGGFHTEGITEAFKKEGISYVLISPRITHVSKENPYLRLMQGEVSWRNYFEVEKGKVNLYKAFVRATRDRLLVRGQKTEDRGQRERSNLTSDFGLLNSDLLKRWRDQILRDLAEQGEIAKAHEYTRFLDELTGYDSRLPFHASRRLGLNRIERFLARLKRLIKKGQLTEENLLRLFQKDSSLPLL